MKLSNEFKVGLMAASALVVLLLGYSFLKGSSVFSKDTLIHANYDRVDGLAVSKPIMINGFQIGRVDHMKLLPNGSIDVTLRINSGYSIPINSVARLESVDLLGNKAVIMDMGNSTQMIENGGTINTNIAKNLLEQVEPVQKKAEVMIAKTDTILSNLNEILNDNFKNNIQSSFKSIANTLANLEKTSTQVNDIVGGERTKIATILNNVQSITENLNNNNSKINEILANASKLSDKIAAANFTSTIDNANKAIADFQSIATKINSGQGTIGLLLKDENLYRNLQYSSASLNNLLIDFKANPKRYVHFSVFGKRTNEKPEKFEAETQAVLADQDQK